MDSWDKSCPSRRHDSSLSSDCLMPVKQKCLAQAQRTRLSSSFLSKCPGSLSLGTWSCQILSQFSTFIKVCLKLISIHLFSITKHVSEELSMISKENYLSHFLIVTVRAICSQLYMHFRFKTSTKMQRPLSQLSFQVNYRLTCHSRPVSYVVKQPACGSLHCPRVMKFYISRLQINCISNE